MHLSLPASFSDANFQSDLFGGGVGLRCFCPPLNLKTNETKPLSVDCHLKGVWDLPEWRRRTGDGSPCLLHSFMLGFSGVHIMSPSWSTCEQPTVKCTFVLLNGRH